MTTDRRVTIRAICVYNLGVKEHTTYKTQRCATTKKQYGEDNDGQFTSWTTYGGGVLLQAVVYSCRLMLAPGALQ